MLRSIVCALVGLVLCAGVGLSADKAGKKGHGAHGVVKKIDAEKGTVTVTVMKKGDDTGTDKDFTVTDDTTVATGTGMKALKDNLIKEGDKVVVQTDDAGKVVSIMPAKKKAPK